MSITEPAITLQTLYTMLRVARKYNVVITLTDLGFQFTGADKAYSYTLSPNVLSLCKDATKEVENACNTATREYN